jgi:hypothetical protein
MIACVIVLVLLNLLVATEPEPGAPSFNAMRHRRGARHFLPTVHPRFS